MYFFVYFFFNDTATTEIYTLSLHDALPICVAQALEEIDLEALQLAVLVDEVEGRVGSLDGNADDRLLRRRGVLRHRRSEEHTSELQSRQYLVCRLLLEKKIKNK